MMLGNLQFVFVYLFRLKHANIWTCEVNTVHLIASHLAWHSFRPLGSGERKWRCSDEKKTTAWPVGKNNSTEIAALGHTRADFATVQNRLHKAYVKLVHQIWCLHLLLGRHCVQTCVCACVKCCIFAQVSQYKYIILALFSEFVSLPVLLPRDKIEPEI